MEIPEDDSSISTRSDAMVIGVGISALIGLVGMLKVCEMVITHRIRKSRSRPSQNIHSAQESGLVTVDPERQYIGVDVELHDLAANSAAAGHDCDGVDVPPPAYYPGPGHPSPRPGGSG